MPFFATLYKYAYCTHARTRRQELLVKVPLQKLAWIYRAVVRGRCYGEFEYHSATGTKLVRFDATNLQFHALYHPIYQHGYEQETGVLLDTLVPPSGVVYDIGSNWGYFSLFVLSQQPGCRVHAFEPFPRTYHDLVECVRQAGVSQAVMCHNLALSDVEGELQMRVPDGVHSGIAEVVAKGDVRIVAKRLDDLPLPLPDCIKLDVEGHELAVLRGGEKKLRASWPFVILENKRDYEAPLNALLPLQFLKRLGYQLYIPAVRRTMGHTDFFLPCGWQVAPQLEQRIEPEDWFALVPFEPEQRFLFQHGVNVLACPQQRLPVLLKAFQE